jgi:predicted nucleic acid-binding protein
VSSLRDYNPEAGWIYIDANIFIHVLSNDPRFGATCKTFLARIEKGKVEACLSPLAIDGFIRVIMANAVGLLSQSWDNSTTTGIL